jgi:hypothetical protein
MLGRVLYKAQNVAVQPKHVPRHVVVALGGSCTAAGGRPNGGDGMV